MPEITIIIPAYNQAQFLADALNSVLLQSFQEFEVIVVDDGSTDETRQIANSFDDPRIRYVYQENRGLSGARNTGIRLTTAPYLLFLDSDDLLTPNALADHGAVRKLNPHAGITVGSWDLIDTEGALLPRDNNPPQNITTALLLNGNPFKVPCALVERRWLEKSEPFDESLKSCEDWDLWLRLAQQGCPFVTFSKTVCRYRIHGQQMSSEPTRMRIAGLQTLDKFFAKQVDSAAKAPSYARVYVKAAGRNYQNGKYEDAKEDLAKAVELDPSLLHNEGKPLLQQIIAWAHNPQASDPGQYLADFFNNLPPSLQYLSKHRRSTLGDIYMQQAFHAYQNDNLVQAAPFVRKAIFHKPQWLTNRGAVSILFNTFFNQ